MAQAAHLQQLQELQKRSTYMKMLLDARNCQQSGTSASGTCAHGDPCKNLRVLQAHIKSCGGCNACSAGDNINVRSWLACWDSHPNEAMRIRCFKCRYAAVSELKQSLDGMVQALAQNPAADVSTLLLSEQHIQAALQPGYVASLADAKQQLVNAKAVLASASSDRNKATRYGPNMVHLNVLLAATDDTPVARNAVVGAATASSAAVQRVEAELRSAEDAAASRLAQVRSAVHETGLTAATTERQQELTVVVARELQMQKLAATLASRAEAFGSKLEAFEKAAKIGAAKDGKAPTQASMRAAGLDPAEVAAQQEKAYAESSTAMGPVLETLAAFTKAEEVRDAIAAAFAKSTAAPVQAASGSGAAGAGAGSSADGEAVNPLELAATQQLARAGVCSHGGASLALRMAEGAHDHGVVLTDARGADSIQHNSQDGWPKAAQQKLLEATGASVASVQQTLPPGLVAYAGRAAEALSANPQADLRNLTVDPTTVKEIALSAALDAARPVYSRNASESAEGPRAGPVAYMRDLVTVQALHVLSGVIATARARQARQIDAVALALRAGSSTPAIAGGSGAGASGSSAVSAGGDPPGLTPPQEVSSGTSQGAKTAWTEAKAAWLAWYESARAKVQSSASSGSITRASRVQGVMTEMTNALPFPDESLKASAPDPSQGPVHPRALAEHALRVACHAACRGYYEPTIETMVSVLIQTGNVATLAQVTPEAVARRPQQAAKAAGQDTIPAGLKALLQGSVPVAGDGRIALPVAASKAIGSASGADLAAAVAHDINGKITANDVLEYLSSQLSGTILPGAIRPADAATGAGAGQAQAGGSSGRRLGSTAADEDGAGGADGFEEFEWEIVPVRLPAAQPSAVSLLTTAGGAATRAVQAHPAQASAAADDDASATGADEDNDDDDMDTEKDGGASVAPSEQAAARGTAAVEPAAAGGRGKRIIKRKVFDDGDDEEPAHGAGRKRARVSAGDAPAGKRGKKDAATAVAGHSPAAAAGKGESAWLPGEAQSLWELYPELLAEPTAFTFLPSTMPGESVASAGAGAGAGSSSAASGADGGASKPVSRAELDRRLQLLRSIVPTLVARPRAVAWLRTALARVQTKRVLAAEGLPTALPVAAGGTSVLPSHLSSQLQLQLQARQAMAAGAAPSPNALLSAQLQQLAARGAVGQR